MPTDRNIRVTRDRLGLSTAELAQLVGVNNRTAHRWLAGRMDVPEPVWRLLDAQQTIAELQEALRSCEDFHTGWTD